jgi:hypothetical protein
MDLADLANHFGPRPKSARCVRCRKRFAIKPVGRIPMYCSGACKQAVFQKVARLTRPKPELPPASTDERQIFAGDERQRLFVWGVLQDAGLIPADKPLPPKDKPDQD